MEGRKNILVIEDTAPVRELLCQLLETSGFNVRGCDDGAAALEAATEDDFHVIITDFNMPNMDGIDATKHLRTRFPASVIIGVSSDDKKEEFLAAGADNFLFKPYRFADILTLMEARR